METNWDGQKINPLAEQTFLMVMSCLHPIQTSNLLHWALFKVKRTEAPVKKNKREKKKRKQWAAFLAIYTCFCGCTYILNDVIQRVELYIFIIYISYIIIIIYYIFIQFINILLWSQIHNYLSFLLWGKVFDRVKERWFALTLSMYK